MADEQYERFEKMTNVDLRAELKRRGCSTSGNKKDLLAKLRLALQKEYEQTSSIQNDLPTTDQHSTIPSSPPVLPVVSSTDEPSNDISTSIDNGENLADISNNVNNEVNVFVSKNKENEEEEKPIEKLGDLTAINDSSHSQNDTSESNINHTPPSSSNHQQSEPIHQTEDLTNENIQPKETTKETESLLKPNRSQLNSSIKFPIRTILHKLNLNLELLQTLISDISLLPESIINDELDSDQTNDSTLETSDFLPSDSITIGELADQKQPTNRTVAIDDVSGRKKSNSFPIRVSSFEGKTNGITTDDPVRIREVTVTNEPSSEILYIRGLTRPFSLMQLKGLLSRYGTLVDGDFWLDKIKSQCFVTYNSVEDAENARQALDGCRWPSTNPKALSIRFARQDELNYSKTHDLPPDHILTETTDRIVEEKILSPTEDISLKDKPSGFLITDDDDENLPIEKEPIKSTEPPAKGLDDYFRKTKAKPSIYWLPLTEEQIIERIRRQEQRKVERDEEQRKRNYEENSHKRRRSISPATRNSKRH